MTQGHLVGEVLELSAIRRAQDRHAWGNLVGEVAQRRWNLAAGLVCAVVHAGFGGLRNRIIARIRAGLIGSFCVISNDSWQTAGVDPWIVIGLTAPRPEQMAKVQATAIDELLERIGALDLVWDREIQIEEDGGFSQTLALPADGACGGVEIPALVRIRAFGFSFSFARLTEATVGLSGL